MSSVRIATTLSGGSQNQSAAASSNPKNEAQQSVAASTAKKQPVEATVEATGVCGIHDATSSKKVIIAPILTDCTDVYACSANSGTPKFFAASGSEVSQDSQAYGGYDMDLPRKPKVDKGPAHFTCS